MLKVIFSVAILLFSFAASADDFDHSPASFWPAVDSMISHCGVRLFTLQNGEKAYGSTISLCEALRVQNSQAIFTADGKGYVASLSDSEDSDGGDLNDLTIKDSSGNVIAFQQDVLAFGDVLVALAHGHANFAELDISNLNAQ